MSSSSSTKSRHQPSPGRGNITGLPRVLNDLVVTYHSTVQKWKSCLVQGTFVLQAVQCNSQDLDAIESSCEKLAQTVEWMAPHLSDMREIEKKLENLSLLYKGKTSPFFSWNFQNLIEAIRSVNIAYESETKIREKLVTCLRTRSSKQLDVIIVLWVHCGQANSQIEALIEAILRECWLT